MQNISEPRYLIVPIDQIELLEDNPREISAREFKKLCNDVKKDPDFLIQRPPLVNNITSENRMVAYAGNQRLKAAKANGMKEIGVWVQDNVPKNIQDERMLKDNLHRGEWDFEKLKAFDFSLLQDAGFELSQLGNYFKETQEVQEDNFPVKKFIEELKEPTTKKGDIYQLGKHRLMCGNSLLEDDVEKLMAGDVADIIYCDPPYNIGLSYDKGIKPSSIKKRYTNSVFNDNMTNHDYLAWLIQIVNNAKSVSKNDAHVFFWCDPKYIGIIQDSFIYSGVTNKSVCFWIKNNFNPVLQMAFHRLIEPCVYGTIGSPKLNNEFRNMTEILNKEIAGRKIFESLMDYTDTWVVSREVSQNYVHPTQKPCGLHEKPLNRCSFPGDIVLDLFGGSGSTLMSCEQMQRSARLMEMDPIFCDVIVKRWESYTGLKASLIHSVKNNHNE